MFYRESGFRAPEVLYTTWVVCAKEPLAESERAVSVPSVSQWRGLRHKAHDHYTQLEVYKIKIRKTRTLELRMCHV